MKPRLFSLWQILLDLATLLLANLLIFWLAQRYQWLNSGDVNAQTMALALLLCVNMAVSLALFAYRRARESHAMLQELNTIAGQDAVTGLANRRQANTILERETERSYRTRRPFSVLLLDIDHFKDVNDNFGHLAGDQVLAAFGQLLQKRARQLDTVARWGGDEFLLICPETEQSGAMALADDIRQRLAQTELPAVNRLTTSIGVATQTLDDMPETLLHRADMYLYAAKNAGRNRVVGEAGSANRERRLAPDD